MKHVTRLRAHLHGLWNRPVHELSRFERSARYTVDLTRHCARELYDDRAEEMAAALTYRTIFGLVPLFVLALIVFRAFGGFSDMGQKVQSQMFEYLGLSSISVPAETPPAKHKLETGSATPATQTAARPAPENNARQPATQASATQATQPHQSNNAQLRNALEKTLAGLNDKISQVSFSSIGAVGLVLLIWAALSLVIAVEDDFNLIYNSRSGRSWTMRIMIYWAAITLGPVLLMVSLWEAGQLSSWVSHVAEAPAVSHGVGAWLVAALHWVIELLSGFTALAATWLLLFLLYVLMPNTRVALKSAAIGSFVAAVMWEIGKWGFGLYVKHAVGYSALYGSLGLIPLFLLWIYVSWLIVLFGIELTYTLQGMRGRQLKSLARRQAQQILIDPWWLVSVMALVGERFTKGQAAAVSEIADRTSLPIRVVTRVLEHLHDAGFVHRVEADEQQEARYALAQSPERIGLSEVIALGQKLALEQTVTRNVPGGEKIDELRGAQGEAAKGRTLASLIE